MWPKSKKRADSYLPEKPKAMGDVNEWRERLLLGAGFEDADAASLAREHGVDLHELLELVERGCPPELAVRIMAPLDDT
jgi:hypothetical protein